MEFNRYLFPIRRWWWLIVASTLVAAFLSFVYINRQPKVYQTHTTLMIGTTITNPNPTFNDFALGQQLASAYANIANRQMIRDATMKALEMNRLPEYNAQAMPNTQLIEIAVSDTDPNRAQVVANELAAQLILLSPTSADSEDQSRQDFINQRLNVLETQINETEDEIKRLQEELGNMISAQQIDNTQNQISSLQSKLSDMQDNYGTLLANTPEGAVNSLTIIEPAAVPSTPIGPRLWFTVLLAAAVGFILSVSEAYLLVYMDDTLKSADDVAHIFPVPVIGHIFEHKNGKNRNQLLSTTDLHQPSAEAFRVLRTNVELSAENQSVKTILVASADIRDGKTFIAANLAKFLAQRNKKVVLLDADLRKPTIHEYFNLPNEKGLVDLFSHHATIGEVMRIGEDKKLTLITAGETSPNPTELLSSDKMNQLLNKLKNFADYVIIDCPPFIIADAMILAAKVDGVLMVVRPGHTRQPLALVTMEQISQVGANLIGVVLNRIPLRDAVYYAGKGHLYTHKLSNYGIETKNNKDNTNGKEEKNPLPL